MAQRRIVSGDQVAIGVMGFDSQTITHVTFRDCVINGPAMLASVRSSFVNCSFASPDSFLTIQPTQVLEGAVIVQDCVFENCQFARVTIVGAYDFIKRFHDELGTSGPGN